uniref:Uncharacterized protein n=1 Tax=Rhizophora mucronata TaxID=61149 RepID=A0A2P2QCQ7_RHIMU
MDNELRLYLVDLTPRSALAQ